MLQRVHSKATFIPDRRVFGTYMIINAFSTLYFLSSLARKKIDILALHLRDEEEVTTKPKTSPKSRTMSDMTCVLSPSAAGGPGSGTVGGQGHKQGGSEHSVPLQPQRQGTWGMRSHQGGSEAGSTQWGKDEVGVGYLVS